MASTLNGRRGTDTGSGTIEAANDKGIKVNGAWLNYSKYPGGRPQDMPRGLEVGDRVHYRTDGSFIKDLSADGPWAGESDAKQIDRELKMPFDRMAAEEQQRMDRQAAVDATELRITKLSCLKSACSAAPHGAPADELISVAEKLVAWALAPRATENG